MNLEKHMLDTMKEWQLKIGYREGSMKLYYPGESLAVLLGVSQQATGDITEAVESALSIFCEKLEPQMGRIGVSGGFERYCLTIPAKGCAYVAETVAEPEFLKLFLAALTKRGNGMTQIEECFARYAGEHETTYIMEMTDSREQHTPERDAAHSANHDNAHHHSGVAFYFADAFVEEYVYWVEQNEFGLTYHRFTREEYRKL